MDPIIIGKALVGPGEYPTDAAPAVLIIESCTAVNIIYADDDEIVVIAKTFGTSIFTRAYIKRNSVISIKFKAV